ncbi:ABC transporter ATP-binding protein [Aminobacter aganoensis]|nr:ATP-binding cassette domain-containing protein [Aminobacter aganoensis]
MLARTDVTQIQETPTVILPPVLSVTGVGKSFGGLHAVNDVGFEVGPGEVVGLIGPNGAGKTTMFNLVCGQLKPDRGSVLFDSVDVTALAPSAAKRRGIMRSYQDGGIFGKLTAAENVMVPMLARGLKPRQADELARKALGRLGLAPVVNDLAERLSGGQRKLIDFARCAVSEASLVLLDEPTNGVHPSIATTMAEVIRERQRNGVACVIISHDLPWIFSLCSRVVVMVAGEKMTEGLPEVVGADPRVHAAYL